MVIACPASIHIILCCDDYRGLPLLFIDISRTLCMVIFSVSSYMIVETMVRPWKTRTADGHIAEETVEWTPVAALSGLCGTCGGDEEASVFVNETFV